MSSRCPNCRIGELAYDPQWLDRGAAILGEIANPLRLFRVLQGPYYGLKDVAILRDQYNCKSCAAHVVICPRENCSKPWVLARKLKHWEKATCPHCRKECVFRLDSLQ